MERIYCKSIVRVQCLVDSEASSRDEKKMSMGSQKTVKITIDCIGYITGTIVFVPPPKLI